MPEAPISQDETSLLYCYQRFDASCTGEPFYDEYDGERFCVLHLPKQEKRADFHAALKRKLANNDFNFQGVWFPDDVSFDRFDFATPVTFSGAIFIGAAHFNWARFRGWADFNYTRFRGAADFGCVAFDKAANFRNATFESGAYFYSAGFTGPTDFSYARFGGVVYFPNASFRGAAYFTSADLKGDVYFSSAIFSDETRFVGAKFSGAASFISVILRGRADFSSAAFGEKADFSASMFSGLAAFISAAFDQTVKFVEVTFGDRADFSRAGFISNVDFCRAIFDADADFSRTIFNSKADFSYTTFRDFASYTESKGRSDSSNEKGFDFQSVRIEKPERFFFPAITLRPHWFIKVDTRKLDLAEVEWPDNLDEELKSLEEKGLTPAGKLLAVAYRRLATSAEDNQRYDLASLFRHESMNLRRKEKWSGFKFWKTDWLYLLYWSSSGYGERVLRALTWLLGIWLLFGALYTQLGFAPLWTPVNQTNLAIAQPRYESEPLRLPRAFLYSLEVMALQKPEPRPMTLAARCVVMLETILGPVQAALLLLAIRRKFLR